MKQTRFAKAMVATLCMGIALMTIGGTNHKDFHLAGFCCFEFGSPHADPNNTNRFVAAKLKNPLRMFKNAELCYTPDNKLYGVVLKLQDRPVVCCGILLSDLSKGATFGMSAEAIREEHRDLAGWAESQYGIEFATKKELGMPILYEFTNANTRISIRRLDLWGTTDLSFGVYDQKLDRQLRESEARALAEKKRVERELALRKNEYGRNRAEQAEYEKSVNIREFSGIAFGRPFTCQPVVFDAATIANIKKGREVLYPRVKLREPFFQIDEARLHIDRATSNVTIVAMTKFYSKVPQKDHIRLIRSGYERPGLYEKQKAIVDWFSKKYQIEFSEDKCYHAFTFRNDYSYVRIERKSYNDSIELVVSGNKTPEKKDEFAEPTAVIPASAIGTFDFIL